ncbi:MAG: DUF1643 domain-containing protein [Thermomicrobiales bacterium]
MQHRFLLHDFAQRHDLDFLSDTRSDRTVHEYVYSREDNGRKVHRFAYSQSWDATRPIVLWVMLNPGTGDTEQRKRPTLERCIRWSTTWGYGGLLIGNLFSVRTKSAKELLRSLAPSDARNELALRFLHSLAAETVIAWGDHGHQLQGVTPLLPILEGAVCLGVTGKGQPRHPLYVKGDAERRPWAPVENK